MNSFRLFTMLLAATVLFSTCKKEEDNNPPAEPEPEPIANFSYSGNTGGSTTVQFSNHSQNASSYEWSFGDGNTSSSANPVHTYPSKTKTYMVTLIASDGAKSDTSSKEVSINVNYFRVDASHTVNGVQRDSFSIRGASVSLKQNTNGTYSLKAMLDGSGSSIELIFGEAPVVGTYSVSSSGGKACSVFVGYAGGGMYAASTINPGSSATINITKSTAAELEGNFNAVTKQIGSSFTYPLTNGYFKLGLE